jgi:hypothetical protein
MSNGGTIIMDKYTNSILFIFKIIIGIFCIIAGLGFIVVSVWVSTFSDVASMILLVAILGGGALINYGLGYAFLGDEYKATRYVRGGDTKFTPVLTPKFLKRRKIVTFIGFVSYILLSIYYIIRSILGNIYQDTDYNTSIISLIIFAIISLVLAFCLFMIYKKTKHIDLKE